MRLRIVSDGTPIGTKVTDEAGNEVHGIVSVAWEVSVTDNLARAILEIDGVEVDVVGTERDLNEPA